jgi:cell division protein FtsX
MVGIEVAQNTGMSKLDQAHRDKIPDSQFAFPKEEKEPLNDAAHVRNAIARFNQVKGVTDKEREEAWKRITEAAKKFGVEIQESNRG